MQANRHQKDPSINGYSTCVIDAVEECIFPLTGSLQRSGVVENTQPISASPNRDTTVLIPLAALTGRFIWLRYVQV